MQLLNIVLDLLIVNSENVFKSQLSIQNFVYIVDYKLTFEIFRWRKFQLEMQLLNIVLDLLIVNSENIFKPQLSVNLFVYIVD